MVYHLMWYRQFAANDGVQHVAPFNAVTRLVQWPMVLADWRA